MLVDYDLESFTEFKRIVFEIYSYFVHGIAYGPKKMSGLKRVKKHIDKIFLSCGVHKHNYILVKRSSTSRKNIINENLPNQM